MGDFSVTDADMQREMNRSGVQELWKALLERDREQAATAYANDAVMHFPQDGTFIAGRLEIASRGLLQPGEVLVALNRIVGDGQVWVSECEAYMHGQKMLLISVAEMHGGLILREARYEVSIPAVRRDRTS
jgi:hypothetical protein